jgi:predicted Fe-Mo cluster-binding NifX family protein
MKIAITAQGTEPTSAVDPRFGRAAGFLVYDTDSGEYSAHDNAQNLNAAQGAGIQAAETLSQLGVQAVITGHCGPKAFRALSAGGIGVYTGVGCSVKEAVARFQQGELAAARDADVSSHWG